MNEATLVDWLCHLYYANTHHRSLITITIWALWLSRNKLVYEGSRQTVNELSSFVLGCVKELEMIEKTYPKASQDQLVRWTPLKTRWAKANFDEGFCSDLHKSSTKVVIRDENGLLMGAYCSWNRNIRSPEATEALAAVQAVRFAQDMGFRRVTFEGDSIVVISKIEAQHLDRSEERESSCSHAKEGFRQKRDMKWVEEGPTMIRETVAMEEMRINRVNS
ncbi:hypothetical protein Godav_025546 [Gossypium davidsonii]|uniref:RNase H type-1 domain-containing protein n=2 Tax=Gossypium TaxID=3633 RepID=A0A7J8TB98_GOSDV|nr:hypothetical protein [Gossypium davidsonii]MBA0644295.1 hypothetical protein [Gossypium klotzschianum]